MFWLYSWTEAFGELVLSLHVEESSIKADDSTQDEDDFVHDYFEPIQLMTLNMYSETTWFDEELETCHQKGVVVSPFPLLSHKVDQRVETYDWGNGSRCQSVHQEVQSEQVRKGCDLQIAPNCQPRQEAQCRDRYVSIHLDIVFVDSCDNEAVHGWQHKATQHFDPEIDRRWWPSQDCIIDLIQVLLYRHHLSLSMPPSLLHCFQYFTRHDFTAVI